MIRKKSLKELIAVPSHILSHIAIIGISAGIALSLPYTAGIAARKFLLYWSLIGNEKIFLLTLEIAAAVLLILFFNYVSRVWRDRRLAATAREAGLVTLSSPGGFLARRRNRRLKEDQGMARDIMVMGSTGYRTFADPKGDLHHVVKNCREARIMLLNPFSEGANIRAKSILVPEITLERLREQIKKSITFLKGLRAVQKDIRLKLYDDAPFLKMAISGDYIWAKHYHAGFDVQSMPEFIFMHNQNPGSLYAAFHRYFLKQWNDPDLPEYDLEKDELVYRDVSGNELKRELLREPAYAGATEGKS